MTNQFEPTTDVLFEIGRVVKDGNVYYSAMFRGPFKVCELPFAFSYGLMGLCQNIQLLTGMERDVVYEDVKKELIKLLQETKMPDHFNRHQMYDKNTPTK